MNATPHPTTRLLDELLTWFATVDETLTNMRGYQLATGQEPDEHGSRLILRDLLASIFEGRDPQPDEELLESGAAMVAWATRAMCDELFFVPPPVPNRAARRANSRRRG